MTFRNFLRSLEVMITKVGYNDDDVGDEFEDDTKLSYIFRLSYLKQKTS